MGAGASRGRSPEGKGRGKGTGADRKLAGAAESAAAAEEVFKAIDADKDKKLTKAELSAAIQKHKRDLSVAWSDSLVEDVVAIFDADGDGMLDLEEFKALLAELKARGGNLDAGELRTRHTAFWGPPRSDPRGTRATNSNPPDSTSRLCKAPCWRR